MSDALYALLKRLNELVDTPYSGTYFIPSLWLNPASGTEEKTVQVNPYRFFRNRVQGSISMQDYTPGVSSTGGEWSKYAATYNMFVRQTTAWNHSGNGELRIEPNEEGFMETGTFLKSIALLPYLKHLGINTIHLLPITEIGMDGNKGSLGSPYAIKDPYALDEKLSEPFLNLDIATQFRAFVDAAHRFGIRVVTEFVFRTAAKDSSTAKDHPGWYYWIDAAIPDRDESKGISHGYGSPEFAEDELAAIKAQVEENKLRDLPAPHEEYREWFKGVPVSVEMVDGSWIGTSEDGTKVRIPGAFADWPPDDVQPPWNDVTYLRMYDHPDFDYIAYNTIRMYDEKLADDEYKNETLWEYISEIIPHFQREYNIDGVMIDMGHALPKPLMREIIRRARGIQSDFAFWEENFAMTKKSRDEGYNVTVGYLWSDEHEPKKLTEFLNMLDTKGSPIPFFATPETHDTPRAAMREGGLCFSKMATIVNSMLPAMFFLHQGFELGDTLPVNTGLGFTSDQIKNLPSHTLPLFSEATLPWDTSDELTGFIAKVLAIRQQHVNLLLNTKPQTFEVAKVSDERALCFVRVTEDKKTALGCVVNMDCESSIKVQAVIPYAGKTITDVLTGRTWEKDGEGFAFDLGPGEGFILNLSANNE